MGSHLQNDEWSGVLYLHENPTAFHKSDPFNNKFSAVYISFTDGWDYQMQINSIPEIRKSDFYIYKI